MTIQVASGSPADGPSIFFATWESGANTIEFNAYPVPGETPAETRSRIVEALAAALEQYQPTGPVRTG